MHILLTGGSGLLGTELRKLRPDLAAPSRETLDITDTDAVRDYVAQHRPGVIVHAAAVTNNHDIEADPSEAIAVNVGGTANLAAACIGTRTRLVYLSTDYVYPGDRGNYCESDELHPANIYAWTKLSGEAAVQAVPNHLIIRTSFGASKFDYPAAFIDKWSSKEYVDLIAPEILEAALGPLTGVVNIGGPRRTLWEYARLRNPDVGEIRIADSEHHTPVDTSLNIDKWIAYREGTGVVRAVKSCRVCGSDALEQYLDLGMMPLANNLAPSDIEAKQMQRFPMQVQVCTACWLSQLTAVVDPKVLFSHYAYRSSISRTYVDHCRSMAKSVGAELGLGKDDLVVDIAGNDGTLLAEFSDELGVAVLNVDPATNLTKISEERGVPAINDFWSADVARQVVEKYARPKLITATNVFAHVDDVRGFVAAAKDCLGDDGALMLEFPYGVDFIEHREFDTIYFEHLSYVLVEPVRQLAESLGMQVFDVQKQDIHGGTARVFIGAEGSHDVRSSVAEFIGREKQGGYHDIDIYRDWNGEIDGLIDSLSAEIRALKASGARLAAFAASAKGNTLLNACGLDADTIDYIVDDTPEKIGRFSPGTGIPIVSRDALAAEPPDYLVILAWNFARDIVAGTSDYAATGGKYIIPIPAFRVVDTNKGESV